MKTKAAVVHTYGKPMDVVELDTPAINNRGEVAFLATVRRGRESLEAIYLQSGGKVGRFTYS